MPLDDSGLLRIGNQSNVDSARLITIYRFNAGRDEILFNQ